MGLIITGINFLLVLTLILLQSQPTLQDSLRAVQIAFRHGDRNPIRPYPNDPYKNESLWPEGFGGMPYVGKERLYNLGKYIKQRYPTTSRRNTVIYSSDTNRSITSGMAAMAGFQGQGASVLQRLEFMNPSNYDIQIVPKGEDKTIYVGHKCPKYNQLYDDFVRNSDFMLDLYEQNQNVFEAVNKYSGFSVTQYGENLILVVDTLLIERSRNLTLPDWAEDLYVTGQLSYMRNVLFHVYMGTEEMKRLRGGYLMKTLIDEFDKLIDSPTSTTGMAISPATSISASSPRMTIYSGHDSTVANWLILLDVYDKGKYGIPYGSAVFLELHESEIEYEFYYIKIFYKNSSDSEPILLEMPKCPDPCDFEQFKILMGPLLIENREDECELNFKNSIRGSSSENLSLSSVYLIFILLNIILRRGV